MRLAISPWLQRGFIIKLCLSSCGLLMSATSTQAAESSPWWVTFGGFSQHFSNQDELNQSHPGLGAEYEFSQDWAVVGGAFKNSTYKWSPYLGVNWMPLEYGIVKLGLTGQLTSNYHNLNNGGIVPLIIPTMSLQYQRFGANIYLIPTLRNVTGSVAIQFKYHF